MTRKTKTLMAALLLSVAGGAAMARGPADLMGLGGDGMDAAMGMMPDGPGPLFDFAAVDADKDGKVTQAELDAFRAARVAVVDADKDGKLSAAELKAMAMQRLDERATAMAAGMVDRLDSDGDGFLTAAEMAAPPAPARVFDMVDADGDGAITEAEITAARDRMAQMRDGMGEGMGDGPRGGHHGHGHGFAGWFFGDDN